uniref:Semaphorin-1A n=4 Tax=Cacopsylla melanoneura TaxID=428564 RepID=A0A8D8ZYR5_9HEMI
MQMAIARWLRVDVWLTGLTVLCMLLSYVQSAWQDNHRRRLVSKLGADVFRFSGNETQTDHFKLILLDGNSILIGGRNLVHNLSVTDLSERQVLQWYSTEENTKMCALKGRDEDNCQNYIRILSRMENNRLLVCGTNSFKPLCREYEIKTGAYTLEKEKAGQAMCPYDPNHNSTAIFVDNELYTGTVADFSGMDPIIYREPLQTEQYDSMSLNAPNFVSSLTHSDFVYFFFRETAVEFINCGKAVFSRVARVCKLDRGGPHRFRNRWTSFLKSRLNCSVPGDFPFYFDEIQSTSDLIQGVYGGKEASLVYGVFTTPTNSITGSAVCAFSLQTISDTFEGNFKEQSELNSNWLPVQSAKVPDPRPGQCVNDSRTLPDLTLNFIKTHSLMDESVPAFFGHPILIETSTNYRFTQIAVDPQIKTPSGKLYDVIFIGTDDGKVLKAVNAVSADSPEKVSSVLIEELEVFSTRAPVVNLKIVRTSHSQEGRLVVVTGGEVVSLALHRCSKVTTCGSCVKLQDPYCAWDKQKSECASIYSPREDKVFAQNVATGVHPDCPPSKDSENKDKHLGPQFSSQEKPDSSNKDDDLKGVVSKDLTLAHYTVETLILAVVAASFAALVVGFASGYFCGRKCHKDEDDNLPYPDTEYEYFEQRQNVNARMSEPKLLPQEEVTYAEPVLITQPNKLHSPKATLRKPPSQENNLFAQFPGVGADQGYYAPAPAPPSRPRDHFGTLRSQREHSNNKSEGLGPGYRDGFGTTRSVKKVYL